LAAIRDRVPGPILDAARSADPESPAALSLERVLARFEPLPSWRVIGPFPRSSPQIFLGERTIDFSRGQAGAAGRPIGWKPWRADPRTGRVDLDELIDGAGGGGADADTTGLSAFAYAEVDSDTDGPALLLLGSSGALVVTVNEKLVANAEAPDARAPTVDAHIVRFDLARGRNRILVQCLHGAGPWSFAIEVARAPAIGGGIAGSPGAKVRRTPDDLRRFAMTHEGDPRRGERIFFDPRGGCASCHSAGGRGTAAVGPDLTGVGRKYDRSELIRSVLEPSRRIADGYGSVTLATHDGRVLTGVVRAENEAEITLVDGQARATRVPKREVATRRAGAPSIMPSHAAEVLSPTEFADLIGYLSSLKPPPAPAQAPRPPSPRP
ncbi:MAG: c-type cytochrome, partial [Isosphaeraceae bacterium]